MVNAVLAGILTTSLVILGISYLIRKRPGYLVQSVGWIVMGIYWVFHTFFVEIHNFSNAFFTGMAAFFSLYLSYYAMSAWYIGSKNASLRFMTGTAVVSGALYFPFDWVPELAGQLIYVVAWQTSAALSLFGYNVYPGEVRITPSGMAYVPIEPTSISIILACTAIQAFALFIGAVAALETKWKIKWKPLAISLIIINLLNIVRNVGIIMMVDKAGVDFELAHSGVGKFFSLLALIFILYYLFLKLPELYENIMGLFTLDKDLAVVSGPKAGSGGG